jgi:endoglucanase
VPDINKWADSVQAVVTAIRGAGAKTQMILLPGNDWTSAAAMPTKSGPALLKITNL